MDEKTARIVELADAAILEAEREMASARGSGAVGQVENCKRAIRNFTTIKQKASSGTLSSSRGLGLGIRRALSEWGVSQAFYAAGCELDDYYMNEFCA